MTKTRIVVVGEINADLVLREPEAFPIPGREVLVESSELVLGSASAICASGLARLGNDVVFFGKVGDDLFGRFCLEEMRDTGIDVDRVRVEPGASTGITVSLSSGSDRALVTSLGTSASLRAEDFPEDLFDDARHLHVSSFYLQRALRPGLPELFRRARRKGLTTSLDPGHDPENEWQRGLHETLGETDLFFPNETELRAITGQEHLADAVKSLAPALVVAKFGARGASVVVENSGLTVVPTVTPNEIVDTTGAGDSFDAGFLHVWLRKMPLETCLLYGVTAGTLSTRALGGTRAQPTSEELEALLNRRDRDPRTENGEPRTEH